MFFGQFLMLSSAFAGKNSDIRNLQKLADLDDEMDVIIIRNSHINFRNKLSSRHVLMGRRPGKNQRNRRKYYHESSGDNTKVNDIIIRVQELDENDRFTKKSFSDFDNEPVNEKFFEEIDGAHSYSNASLENESWLGRQVHDISNRIKSWFSSWF